MRKIILFLWIFILLINVSYALPIWVLALGTDFFIFFFWFIISIFSTVFFYFKNLKLFYKAVAFFLLILSFFPLKYIYLENEKEKVLNEYIHNIKSLWLYDLYHDWNLFLFSKYNKSININDFKTNYKNYYLLDIRENSEQFWLDKNYLFKHIRFPNLIKNHNIVLWNIDKKFLVTCIDGNRWKIVSSFLWWLWYDSYYLKWWLKELWINYWYRNNTISNCKNDRWIKVFVWIDDKNKSTIDIAYMQLTDDDVKNIIKYFEKNNILSTNNKIRLLCNKYKWLNCWVWRQSLGLLLKNLWYKNICLWNK
jgi:hypothetical protein